MVRRFSLLLPLLLTACVSQQKYPDAHPGFPDPGPCPPPLERYMGTNSLLYLGTILLTFGVLSVIMSFWGLTKAFVSLKMAIVCIIGGLLTIALYNVIKAHEWVLYLGLGIAALLAFLTFLPTIRLTLLKIRELLDRKDRNNDGVIGFEAPAAAAPIPPSFRRTSSDDGLHDPNLD